MSTADPRPRTGAPPSPSDPRSIVSTWAQAGLERWFVVDPTFDASLRHRFQADHLAAARGDRDAWSTEPEGALALLILLDQIPRNIFRGTAHMFATDPLALRWARLFLDAGFDQTFDPDLRLLFYLPFTHSEALDDQATSVARRQPLGPRIVRKAAEHRDIIARFGRFPHRNAMLGRDTTPQERDYLAQGGFAG